MASTGSDESKVKYARLIAETVAHAKLPEARSGTSINSLILAYWKHAQAYYVKNGRPTDEQAGIRIALKRLRLLYGSIDVSDFGPIALKTIRGEMIADDLSRDYINETVSRIIRAFKWATENELIAASIWHRLQSVRGLRKGEQGVRETDDVTPVADSIVDATLAKIPNPVVADMIRLQRRLGRCSKITCPFCDQLLRGDTV